MKVISGDLPDKNGVFVCYEDINSEFPRKVFLTHINGKWNYTGSDQKFRGVILGYIGPFPTISVTELKSKPNIKYAISTMSNGLHGCFTKGPYTSVKDLLKSIGNEGDYIFKLYPNKEAEVIGKWSEKKNKWLKKR